MFQFSQAAAERKELSNGIDGEGPAFDRIDSYFRPALRSLLSVEVTRHFDFDYYVRLVEAHRWRDWNWVGEKSGKWLEGAILCSEASWDGDGFRYAVPNYWA